MPVPVPTIEEHFSNILQDSATIVLFRYVAYTDNIEISDLIARFTPLIPSAIRLFLYKQTADERLSYNSRRGADYSLITRSVSHLMVFELLQFDDLELYPLTSSHLSYIRRHYYSVRRQLFGGAEE